MHPSICAPQGTIPLWSAGTFDGGYPLYPNGSSAELYPPRIALAAITSPEDALAWFSALNLFFGGLFAYLFARSLRIRRFGAFLTGISWMFASFNVAWLPFAVLAPILALLPLDLLLVRRAWQRKNPTRIVLAGSAIGLTMMAGHIVYMGLTVVIALGYGGCLALDSVFKAWRLEHWRAFRYLLVPAGISVVGLGIAAVTLLPTVENLAQLNRSKFALFQSVPRERLRAYVGAPERVTPCVRSGRGSSHDRIAEPQHGICRDSYGVLGDRGLRLASARGRNREDSRHHRRPRGDRGTNYLASLSLQPAATGRRCIRSPVRMVGIWSRTPGRSRIGPSTPVDRPQRSSSQASPQSPADVPDTFPCFSRSAESALALTAAQLVHVSNSLTESFNTFGQSEAFPQTPLITSIQAFQKKEPWPARVAFVTNGTFFSRPRYSNPSWTGISRRSLLSIKPVDMTALFRQERSTSSWYWAARASRPFSASRCLGHSSHCSTRPRCATTFWNELGLLHWPRLLPSTFGPGLRAHCQGRQRDTTARMDSLSYFPIKSGLGLWTVLSLSIPHDPRLRRLQNRPSTLEGRLFLNGPS